MSLIETPTYVKYYFSLINDTDSLCVQKNLCHFTKLFRLPVAPVVAVMRA